MDEIAMIHHLPSHQIFHAVITLLCFFEIL